MGTPWTETKPAKDAPLVTGYNTNCLTWVLSAKGLGHLILTTDARLLPTGARLAS